MPAAQPNPVTSAADGSSRVAVRSKRDGVRQLQSHVDGGEGAASFHQILSRSNTNGGYGLRPVKWRPANPNEIPAHIPYDAEETSQCLRHAYADWGHPEVGAAAAKWFENVGLLP